MDGGTALLFLDSKSSKSPLSTYFVAYLCDWNTPTRFLVILLADQAKIGEAYLLRYSRISVGAITDSLTSDAWPLHKGMPTLGYLRM